VARKGVSPEEVIVREITNQDIKGFKAGMYTSKNYVSKFPTKLSEAWRFSPFSNEFELADKYGIPLEEIADVHTGLQIYGVEDELLNIKPQKKTLNLYLHCRKNFLIGLNKV